MTEREERKEMKEKLNHDHLHRRSELSLILGKLEESPCNPPVFFGEGVSLSESGLDNFLEGGNGAWVIS